MILTLSFVVLGDIIFFFFLMIKIFFKRLYFQQINILSKIKERV